MSSPAPVSCVISSFKKREDLRANLLALREQTRPPAQILVVDNHSQDGSAPMVREHFPEVELIETPNDRFGACETFNMGFRAAREKYVAILDDDVVLPPTWIEKLLDRFEHEPESTALLTTKVVEPLTPDPFLAREDVTQERYLATFRGCGSLIVREIGERAGWYDERFFIYGNERDLSARILGLGYRILSVPDVITFHGTPYGIKAGQRSLYYHVRNFWLYAFKNCRWRDVIGVGAHLTRQALFGSGGGGGGDGGKTATTDAGEATGTIGLQRSVRETPGGHWIAVKATLAALGSLPYCLRRRKVCTAPDFRPPLS